MDPVRTMLESADTSGAKAGACIRSAVGPAADTPLWRRHRGPRKKLKPSRRALPGTRSKRGTWAHPSSSVQASDFARDGKLRPPFSSDENSAVLVTKEREPIGTRIFGRSPASLRRESS